MNVNELSKRIQIDELSYEQLMWFKFAKQLNLDELLLDAIIIEKHSNKKYQIAGLHWKYILNTENVLNIFDNELVVHIIKVFEVLNDNEDKQKICEPKIGIDKFFCPCTTSSQTSNLTIPHALTTSAIVDTYHTFSRQIAELNDLSQSKRINPVIDCDKSNYISISKLISEFIPEDTSLSFPVIIKAQKFKISLV
jgi:hypothetical protein